MADIKKHRMRVESIFLQTLRESKSVEAACKAAQISRASAARWRLADTGFAQRWRDAYEAGTDRLEDVSIELGTVGFVRRRDITRRIARNGETIETIVEHRDISENHLAMQLKARRPDKYRERVTTEHTGKDGGPIQTVDLTRLSDDQLERLAEILGSATQAPGATPLAIVDQRRKVPALN